MLFKFKGERIYFNTGAFPVHLICINLMQFEVIKLVLAVFF